MRVTPREIFELAERLLLRRGFPRGAIPTAAAMVVAAECAETGALRLVHQARGDLRPGPWRAIRIREESPPVVDAGGASSLIVAPSLLELGAGHGGRVSAVRLGQPELLAMLPAYARCRAPVRRVVIEFAAERVVVEVDGPAAALRPPASVVVDDTTWRELMVDANEVLAPASLASRADAG